MLLRYQVKGDLERLFNSGFDRLIIDKGTQLADLMITVFRNFIPHILKVTMTEDTKQDGSFRFAESGGLFDIN